VERTVDQKVRRSADPLTPNEIEEVIGDPSWFPLEFDVSREEFRFALVPPETLREVAFIRSLKWDGREVRSVPLTVVRDAAIPPSRLHVILHSSLGGSTLLTRALGRPGVGTPLQEPPILTDVIAYGLQKRVEPAIAAAQAAVRLKPDSPVAREQLRRLLSAQ